MISLVANFDSKKYLMCQADSNTLGDMVDGQFAILDIVGNDMVAVGGFVLGGVGGDVGEEDNPHEAVDGACVRIYCSFREHFQEVWRRSGEGGRNKGLLEKVLN